MIKKVGFIKNYKHCGIFCNSKGDYYCYTTQNKRSINYSSLKEIIEAIDNVCLKIDPSVDVPPGGLSKYGLANFAQI